MRKQTMVIVLGVFTITLATLGVLPCSDLTKSQRQDAFLRLVDHILSYQGEHDGHFPSTLQQLASSEPLEPDLTKLIHARRVSYHPPEDHTPPKSLLDCGCWELGIDGEASLVGPVSY